MIKLIKKIIKKIFRKMGYAIVKKGTVAVGTVQQPKALPQKKAPAYSPQQGDTFSNDFRFNMFVESNLDIDVKRNIIAQTFYKNVGYYPNIENPTTFSEKVLWLKLHYADPRITMACDKVKGKSYVDRILGPGYTVPILKTYDNVFDIDPDELPDRFALKVNWATGCNIIVKDKSKVNLDKVRATLDRWTLPWKSSYYGTFNRGYRETKAVIFAEEYLDIPKNTTEYKVFCFNGKAKFTLVELDFFGNNPKRAYYDRNWVQVPYSFGKVPKVSLNEMPEQYPEIIRLAEILAEPFPYIRVDFYDINGKLYVGELTFYSGGGFSKLNPREWDYILGKELDISTAMECVATGEYNYSSENREEENEESD